MMVAGEHLSCSSLCVTGMLSSSHCVTVMPATVCLIYTPYLVAFSTLRLGPSLAGEFPQL